MSHGGATLAECGSGSLADFLRDERGVELVEYAILTFLVVIIGYVVLVNVRSELTIMFEKLLCRFLPDFRCPTPTPVPIPPLH